MKPTKVKDLLKIQVKTDTGLAPRPPMPQPDPIAALGAACVVIAIGGFAMTGLAPLTARWKLIVFKVRPLANGLLLVLGQVCLRGASRTQPCGRNASSTCCAAAVGVTSPADTLASRPGTRAATSPSPRSNSTSVSETSDHIHCRA
jgi:hypothetical protein